MLNRNDDNNDERNMILFCVAAASAVLLLFLIVLFMHENKKSTKYTVKEDTARDNAASDIEIGRTDMVSKDLDFWEMYDGPADDRKRETSSDDTSDDNDNKSDSKTSKTDKTAAASSGREKDKYAARSSSVKYDDEEKSSSEKRIKSEDDKYNDGRHIKVSLKSGESEWVEISDEIPKNTYDFDEYLTYDNGFIKYNAGGARCYTGVDLSSYDGNVDFEKLKSSGVDYVMIRVGARGYDTGLVTIDNKFIEYAKGAQAAGLMIGTYFTTNAITDVEAVEEANYAVAAGMNYNVKFPVVIDITTLASDSRTDKLTPEERSEIVKKFCDTVKSFGKTPAICATRDCLIAGLDLKALDGTDVWLKDETVTADSYVNDSPDDKPLADNKSSSDSSSSDININYNKKIKVTGTDYPYRFNMWQYSTRGSVNGMSGSVNLDISFVNYAER